jgi:L,D-transpeptidase ErfK/SrfK
MKGLEIILKYKRSLFFLLGSLLFVLGISFVQPIITHFFFLGSQPGSSESLEVERLINQYNLEIDKLDKTLQSKTPQSTYLIINSSANEFSIYKGADLIKKDKCSTGSYILLKNGDQQQWMFKTPKGIFKILGKTTSPVWKKPDWAFVEAALPVPSANHSSRFEYGVLGDYSLSLGNGYLIHGTLYQRFLGLPVTHGCIRLNDENLEMVYKTLKVGAKVYIY